MMVATSRLISRLGAGFGLLCLTLALLVLPAAPAQAHAVLVSSSPVPESVLSSAPSEVVLTFSEPVSRIPDKVRVIAPDGSRADRGEPVFENTLVRIPVDPGAGRGTYLVSYRVVSADSHPVAGGYTYSVVVPSAPPVDDGADGRVNPVVDGAISVAKYIGYVGLLLLTGAALVLARLWPGRLPRRGAARVLWAGWGLVMLSTLAGIWLQVPYVNGGGLLAVTGTGLGDVLGSTFGAAHLARLGLLLAGLFLLRPVAAGVAGGSDRLILALLGGAALLTWPIAGHPAASPVPAVSVPVDAVHLGAMAVWLGGLVMVAAFLLRRANERELAAILPIWSRWAALSVSALLLAGIVSALIEVGTPAALVSTGYGRLLLAKAGLFALVLGVAVYSRRLVERRTAEREPTGLRRAIWVELGVAAVVLALSSVLVQTTPARNAGADVAGRGGADYYNSTLTSSIYSLQVQVDPARRGNNSVHAYAYTLDNRPLPVVEWRVTAALPSAGVEPIEVPLLPLTDNHVTGEINLPAAGDWELRFTVRISEIDQATVLATVPIR
ncbi:copper resistance CopC/CopD family protein [Melissospora conviva]|uniref:copper resistance CopC/CopD family protein n=1 Tax=Melissospora conviva TaxID=3388432 RepID=UPI003B7C44CB